MMTLQEALDWFMADKAPWNELQLMALSRHDRTAIATILNAVVKGELKHE
jgi:hypothetical protein